MTILRVGGQYLSQPHKLEKPTAIVEARNQLRRVIARIDELLHTTGSDVILHVDIYNKRIIKDCLAAVRDNGCDRLLGEKSQTIRVWDSIYCPPLIVLLPEAPGLGARLRYNSTCKDVKNFDYNETGSRRKEKVVDAEAR